ncbi:hypothetical protein Q9R34_12780 [Enterobacter sp. BRE11]|nr:hypothetical protein [Enterobacter sp. BRE11]
MSEESSPQTTYVNLEMGGVAKAVSHHFVVNRALGHEAGRISVVDGQMTFEGDADESAQILLKLLKERYDAEWQAMQQKLDAISSGLGNLAGAMLNRTLDSGSKQAVAYADCADMVAKFAAQLRAGQEAK